MLTVLAITDARRGFKHDVYHMTPEEKAAAAAAEAEAKAKADKEKADAEFETGLEGLSDDEKTTKRAERQQQSSDKDLDAEIAAEEERKRIAEDAFQKREADRKAREATGGAGDADKPLTRADLASIQQEATDAATRIANASAALTIARSLAASDKEAQLIVLKWQNRSFPAGMSLDAQVQEAYAIANTKRLIGERNEALRVAKNRGNANQNGAATHRDGAPAGEPAMSDADKLGLKQAGFEWDGAKRLYKKSLKGGKQFLYKDMKSGKTWTQAA